VPEPAVVETDLIRPFPVSRLRGSINEALNGPEMEGKSVAVVATGVVDEVGARLGVFVRMGDEWSFGGTLEKRWSKPLRAEAMVAWSR
jgi:hypothetical protein